MTLGERAFDQAHIPGSEHFASVDDALESLDPDEEIVVYCTDRTCLASQFAYRALVGAGSTNVRRYASGLVGWEEAGLELVRADPG
jgi:rhodanese-related sulfurtransferase